MQLDYFLSNMDSIVADIGKFDTALIRGTGAEEASNRFFKIAGSHAVEIGEAEFDSITKSARSGKTSPVLIVDLKSAENTFNSRIMGFKGSGVSRSYEVIHGQDGPKCCVVGAMIMR
jgi:hypothetical protein